MAFRATGSFYYDDTNTSVNLGAGSTIANGADIYISFSSDISSASVLSYTVSLFRTLPDGGNETPVDLSSIIVVNDGQENPTWIKITPASDLIANGHYTLYLPKGRYGIRSTDGESLQHSFSVSFATEAAAAGAGPSTPADTVELSELPTSLYLVSSMPLNESIMQYGAGSVIAKFNGRLPKDEEDLNNSETNVLCTVDVRHPLGLSMNVDSDWADNFSSQAIGSELFLTSKVSASSIDLNSLMELGVDVITSDGIACVSKAIDTDGNISLDFDVNKIFEINFSTPFEDSIDPLTFMGILSPFFTSIQETKLEIGPFVQQYDDFTLSLLIYRHSITAEQLWKGDLNYASLPIRAGEYVQARTKRDILNTYLTDPAGASSNFSIGDFKMSGKELSRYIQDSIKALDLKIIVLENALKRGSSSTEPYTDYAHQSLPVKTKGSYTGGAANSNTLYSSRSLTKGG